MNRESTNKPNLATCARGVNSRNGVARSGPCSAAHSTVHSAANRTSHSAANRAAPSTIPSTTYSAAATAGVTVAIATALGVACSAAPPASAPPARLAVSSGAASVPPAPRPVRSPHAGATDTAGAHPHHGFADAETWAKVFDAPERDAWQRPDEVLRAMELEPAMTVADVGAGTGYFSVRLARAVPDGEVIATDIEPDMVRFLGERARHEGLQNLRALQAAAGASGLSPQSVDRILLVHVWHHLGDRQAYARDLAAALRPGGRVFIVDFQLSARQGPPASMRVAPEAILAALESAGLTARVSPIELPDQYLVEARRTP